MQRTIYKVVRADEAEQLQWPHEHCLVWDADGSLDPKRVTRDKHPWGGWLSPTDRKKPSDWNGFYVNEVQNPKVINPGDVIRLRPNGSQVEVLFRRGSNANALFVTERCNSFCLMCSQPPRDEDDSWRVRDVLDLIPLVDKGEKQLGITGGEPTLLDDSLLQIITACRNALPGTALHILTNGRRFADAEFASRVAQVDHPGITWAVPLYADVPARHDYVVQADGAFDATLRGLYHLGCWRKKIELRVVLHRETIPRLRELAAFIFSNLPFVAHVAFMGLEPMGFAKLNRDVLWIDPLDYADCLADACFHLVNRGMQVSVYNLPLCVLPTDLWPFARKSISDWKNTYTPECADCLVQSECAGFFASAGSQWRSRGIRPMSKQGPKASRQEHQRREAAHDTAELD